MATVKKSLTDPAELRSRAEEIALEKNTRETDGLPPASPEDSNRTLHELQVHQIELEMQNEELRRAQTELEAAWERYFELYDLAPVGYFTLSKAGLILEANLAGARMLGVDRSSLVRQPLSRFILKSDQDINYRHQRRLFESGEPQSCELRMTGSEEEIIWVELQSTSIRDQEGELVHRCVASDITVRKMAEEQRNTLLIEKEMLLKETHHRIKNNMGAVISLLSMQGDAQDEPACRTILNDAANRVQSMMMLYDQLYRSQTHNALNVKDYLPPLIDKIMSLFSIGKPVRSTVAIEDFVLTADVLSPIGIIVNELISNSMKYAFRGRDGGLIDIAVSKRGYTVTLRYGDDGIGLPESIDVERSDTFGLELIQGLTRQIGGKLSLERNRGTRYTIVFTC